MISNKPWLSQYPAGVPKTINPDRYSSIMELYEECFDRFRGHPMSNRNNFGIYIPLCFISSSILII
ncbi:hypothetical protein ACQKDA_01680 [Psychrobacter sp. NPDC078370]|uniref:hypothetical protein n=1 Tax=Psychrobacter TaxID=497 RepID=UPI0019188DDE|nr:hypothetical protein [Psychrobacter nivimaris]